jgi:hypothetical protein
VLSDEDEPPTHLRELDPERYRDVARSALADHPGDAWCAAVAVWRAWQDEAIAWQAERGIVWRVKGFKKQLGPGRPPTAWVREEFALPFNEESSACPPRCGTHGRRKARHSRG